MDNGRADGRGSRVAECGVDVRRHRQPHAGDLDYPIAEFNDFKRTYPDSWDEARSTLANYDPMSGLASKVMLDASKGLLRCFQARRRFGEELLH